MKLEEVIAKVMTVPIILIGIYVFLLSYHQSNIIIRWIYYIMTGILWVFPTIVLISRIEGSKKETETQKSKTGQKEIKDKNK
ncbi:MAG: hypothetical protein RXR51_03365 [Nitrososphaeria archaeon]